MKTKISLKGIIGAVALFLFWAIIIYHFMPALTFKSYGFWLVILGILASIGVLSFLISYDDEDSNLIVTKISGIAFAIILVIFLIAMLLGSRLFQARAYSSILNVEDADESIIPTVEKNTNSIALMDTESAESLGKREIGSLSEVVSQYDLSEAVQINYNGKPVKVIALKYDGFFKWNNNHKVPGYIIVDPVSMDAKYVKLDDEMIYVPSAYFSENLTRKIHNAYPTTMFRNLHFEIDEQGNPYYVATTIDHSINLFGGTVVTGCIIANPVTGEITKYSVNDIPQWVDVVFYGYLICDQYNNHAQLQNGFWNSVIGQKDSKKVTEYPVSSGESSVNYTDYGYICMDDDVYIYTGVTSVTNDSSNIGFILSNERTGKTKFVSCAGADEFSAMGAAEGEVQEKGYKASFPSLILVDNVPTYIMVLKDQNGLVKLYACVRVENIGTVATSSKQADCIEKYKALLNGEISKDDATSDDASQVDTSTFKEKTITVQKIKEIVDNGNTYVYIVDENNNIYKAKYTDVLDIIFVSQGDKITITTDGTYFQYHKN